MAWRSSYGLWTSNYRPGMDVVDKIAKSKKDKMDKPLEDITIESIQVQGSKFDD